MKKSLIAIAALAATSAFAQSSVSISGVADVGIAYGNNVAPGAAKLSVGGGNNSRVIFAGVEDLGGGMAATFAAQMRYDPTSGNTEGGGARPLFQGETRVGLRGGFGHIRLGRGLTALQAPNGGMIDPWGVSTVGGSVYAPGYATDYIAGGEGRTDGIFYDTPNFSGFSGSITYSPRTVNTSSPAVVAPAVPTSYSKNFVSLAATYVNGPIAAVIGTETNRYGDSLLNIGGNYDLGMAKLYAGYGAVKGGSAAQRFGIAFASVASRLPGLAASQAAPVAADGKITAYSFGANIPFGAATARVGYSTWKSDAVGASSDSKIGLGVNYALSKRTSIYSDFASITRKNSAAGTNPATNNDRVTAFDLGIAHSF